MEKMNWMFCRRSSFTKKKFFWLFMRILSFFSLKYCRFDPKIRVETGQFLKIFSHFFSKSGIRHKGLSPLIVSLNLLDGCSINRSLCLFPDLEKKISFKVAQWSFFGKIDFNEFEPCVNYWNFFNFLVDNICFTTKATD